MFQRKHNITNLLSLILSNSKLIIDVLKYTLNYKLWEVAELVALQVLESWRQTVARSQFNF